MALLFCAAQQSASATTYSWVNGKIASWNDPTVWSGGNIPVSDPDTVISFSTSLNSNGTNNLGPISLNRLSASNSSSSNKSLTVAGSAANNLNFVKSSGDVLPTLEISNTSVSGPLTVSIPFTVTDALTITNSGTKSASISGAIINNGGITLDGSGTGTITLGSGVISGGGGITYNGSYNVTASGANTYTGVTTFGNGTVGVGSIGNGGAAGNLGKATNAATNLVFDGGTLKYTGGTATSDRAFTINTGKTATIEVSTQASNLTLAGATGAPGTGGLAKTGLGTLTLSGVNTYVGDTTISAGTLALGGSASLASAIIRNNGIFDVSAVSGGYTIASGQTLKGTGSVTGAISIAPGATLAPGNSPGVMTFNGALTLAGSTVLEVNGILRGTDYDGVDTGAGLLTYGGDLSIVFGSSFLTGAETFDLFNIGAGGSAGDFSSVSISGSYIVNLTNTAGVWTGSSGGYDFTFTQSTGDLVVLAGAIPEPSTCAALAGALALGAAAWRRGRRPRV